MERALLPRRGQDTRLPSRSATLEKNMMEYLPAKLELETKTVDVSS